MKDKNSPLFVLLHTQSERQKEKCTPINDSLALHFPLHLGVQMLKAFNFLCKLLFIQQGNLYICKRAFLILYFIKDTIDSVCYPWEMPCYPRQ